MHWDIFDKVQISLHQSINFDRVEMHTSQVKNLKKKYCKKPIKV